MRDDKKGTISGREKINHLLDLQLAIQYLYLFEVRTSLLPDIPLDFAIEIAPALDDAKLIRSVINLVEP